MKTDFNTLKKFFCLFRTQWIPYMIVTLVVASRNFVITYINAMISSRAITIVTRETNDIIESILCMIGLVICFAVVDSIGIYFQTNTIHRISMILREKIFGHLLNVSVSDTEQLGKRGEILSRMNYDIDNATGLLSYGLLTPIMYCISGIGATIIVLKKNWRICVSIYALALLAFILQFIFTRKIRKYLNEIQEEKTGALSVAMQTFASASGIKMSNMSHYVEKLFETRIKSYKKAYLKKGKFGGAYGLIQGGVRLTCFWGVFCYGLFFAHMELETVVFISQITPLIGTMVLSLTDCMANIQRALVGIERILELFDIPIEQSTGKEFIFNIRGSVIETENLVCGYKNNEMKISNINTGITDGKMIALKGVSGCGKTSLLRLLLKLYPYTAGNLRVLQQEIDECSSDSIRENVAYVPQENAIFPGTIRDNLLLGNHRSDISEEEVLSILVKVGADDWIGKIGLDASLKEDGGNLSGGQRQMLSIVRAILYKKPILILDEAFASLDEEHINRILSALVNIEDILYVIVVTHDIRVIQKCSTVIELQMEY